MLKKYLDKYKKEIKKCIEDLKHKETFYKQIPNLLTFSRAIGMIPINVLFLTGNTIPAFILTALILSTDFFDGKIARKYNIQSEFGADLDAICDKVMVGGLIFPLVFSNPLLLVNIFMESAISMVNILGRANGMKTKTLLIGKVKTWFLSLTLLTGYLVQFFGISWTVLFSTMVATLGMQGASLVQYIQEYFRMKKEDSNVEEVIFQEEKVEQSEVRSNDRTSRIEELRREREFLLGINEPDRRLESKKRKRNMRNETENNKGNQ